MLSINLYQMGDFNQVITRRGISLKMRENLGKSNLTLSNRFFLNKVILWLSLSRGYSTLSVLRR